MAIIRPRRLSVCLPFISRYKMASGSRTHKYYVHVVLLLIITVLTELCSLSAAPTAHQGNVDRQRIALAPSSSSLLNSDNVDQQRAGDKAADTGLEGKGSDDDVPGVIAEGAAISVANDLNQIASDGELMELNYNNDTVEGVGVTRGAGAYSNQTTVAMLFSSITTHTRAPIAINGPDKLIDHHSKTFEYNAARFMGAAESSSRWWRTTTAPPTTTSSVSTTTMASSFAEDSVQDNGDAAAAADGRNNNRNKEPASDEDNSPEVDSFSSTASSTPDEDDEESAEEQTMDTDAECILGSSDTYLAWWIKNDGSLRTIVENDNEIPTQAFVDLSGNPWSGGTGSFFDHLFQRFYERRQTKTYVPIKFLSLARNNLNQAPYASLSIINDTLEYLSLAGNNFSILNSSLIKDTGWATFPVLEELKELDLRSCGIVAIQEEAFSEMSKLQKMYLSNNNLITVSSRIFANARNLIHLDLSYNTIEYTLTNYYTNPFERFTRGMEIDEFAFSTLTKLKFLDFSYTRLEPSSMKSFVNLPAQLEQMSLCYTGIIIIGLGMFHRLPNLKVLDLSGNSALTGTLNHNTFDGLQDSLEILAFQNSSVKHLDWMRNLRALKMLKLNDNNINLLSSDTFRHLSNIDILDLSDNHIGNWFSRVFEANGQLRILNLRSNNINVITTEMMKDFSELEFLGLGGNNFICNCMLRDLLDQALQNSMVDNGLGYVDPVPNIDDLLVNEVLKNYLINIGLEQTEEAGETASVATTTLDLPIGGMDTILYNSYTRILRSYVRKSLISYRHILTSQVEVNADTISPRAMHVLTLLQQQKFGKRRRYIPLSHLRKPSRAKRSLSATNRGGGEGEEEATNYFVGMDFNFQLLDFDEETYTCFNATTNQEYIFTELESCLMERVSEWSHLVSQLRPHNQGISVVLCVIFVIMFITCIAYYKWWYIRYFFILIKNATILSFLNKESMDNGSRKSFGEISRSESYLYDVFVSYCDENRDWVINELLPNIEQRQEISICLHERDFLVGLSILENIIACMDRSKCLLLVVSQSFLLSQWCQFEMHLAQHRLLETCRERLVLILLEDIPKRKRPKTLGYLMKTKTYIKWPTISETGHRSDRSVAEERKIFWRRLRRALIETDWESDANS